MNEFLTLKEISKYLRLSTFTIYRMVQRGEMPAVKIGRKWRFNKGRVDEWLLAKEKNIRLRAKRK